MNRWTTSMIPPLKGRSGHPSSGWVGVEEILYLPRPILCKEGIEGR
ncbi:MAG: hypothetical protein HY578_07020 [Nitrospinae bacterium]|nr:hypothetical protein [Nitrospinota bacterium]